MATILIYYANSSDPETAIFVLCKGSRIKCCLFLQESSVVAKEDMLQPIIVPVPLLSFNVIQGQ